MRTLESDLGPHLASGRLLYVVTRLGRIKLYTPNEYRRYRAAWEMMGWEPYISIKEAEVASAAISSSRLSKQ